jgi:hypothetical protein
MTNIATTRDIGLAIRDALEHLTHVTVYRDDEHGDDEAVTRCEIWNVDAGNADNLVIELVNGQKFTIRVVQS